MRMDKELYIYIIIYIHIYLEVYLQRYRYLYIFFFKIEVYMKDAVATCCKPILPTDTYSGIVLFPPLPISCSILFCWLFYVKDKDCQGNFVKFEVDDLLERAPCTLAVIYRYISFIHVDVNVKCTYSYI